jgi:hypothetical protein
MALTQESKDLLQKLRFHANKNVVSKEDLELTLKGELPPVGDHPSHVAFIDHHRVVFSYEEQPVGLCLHISISKVGGPAMFQIPLQGDMLEIAELLGYRKSVVESTMWFDKPGILNIVQKVVEPDGPMIA